MAGLTSFITVAYILIVNPMILKDAGIPLGAGLVATIASSVFGCLWMAFRANAPIILIPGMGVNAFFSYTVVQSLGLSWQEGLTAVTLSGILFWIIATTTYGNKLAEAVPSSLKHGITAGIGLFLTFIGLQKAQWIHPDPVTFIRLGNFAEPIPLITLIGLMVTLFLYSRGITGSFFLGLLFTALSTYGVGAIPDTHVATPQLKEYSQVFFSLDWGVVITLPFWVAVFSLTMIVVFENLGLLQGILPQQEKFPKAYRATAVSSFVSGLLGTSPTIASAESTSGIAEGGRTGMVPLVTGMLFLCTLPVMPLVGKIPDHAVAPVLIIIGALMVQSVEHISFSDFSEGFPAFFILAGIPLTSSIADGLAFGFITYPLCKVAIGKGKQVPSPVYLIGGLFLVYLIVASMIH
ncbi:putative MFS transporter, AGZA family, xanthine/uracil permease [Melghirimyces algeriensis]|uniref:Putative MFS transporter, AGZA family, xanthine/uracil permease n=2 Tax=Melghirimyces algeriensis TaxID=910412 RepID=A0A521DKE9_9BACL|nr:putative MFS transporter, AGZA family, xanthine/uracil permease [Melghirimyces algeriensis]